jgi:hypothetical protein
MAGNELEDQPTHDVQTIKRWITFMAFTIKQVDDERIQDHAKSKPNHLPGDDEGLKMRMLSHRRVLSVEEFFRLQSFCVE